MIGNKRYTSLSELNDGLIDFVHWYNHERVHSSLGYVSSEDFKNADHVK